MTKRKPRPKPVAAAQLDTRYGLPKLMPKSAKERRFCEEYIKDADRNAMRAALSAGYSEKNAKQNAYLLEKRNHDYIQWLLAHQAQAAAKQIAIELEPVLQEIAKIAFVNEYDYLVFESAKEQNKPPVARRKRLDELTREQMVAIEVKPDASGALGYILRNKEGRLVDLVKHLGGFSEKIILEHRHRHLHAHVDLSKVPLDQLEAMEANMQKLIEGRTRGSALEVK